MNSESITYQLSYHKLEQELEALSYDIHICDKQLGVYSTHIADMILRTCMDIEAIAKILHSQHEGGELDNKLRFDYDCLDKLNLQKDCTILAMPTQAVTSADIRLCFPFYKDELRGDSSSKPNYRWNNAYQSLKHNKTVNLSKYGNIANLFYSMSALFLLNCRLSKTYVQSGAFYAIDTAEEVYTIPEIGGLIRPKLCEADKNYCQSKIKEMECTRQ